MSNEQRAELFGEPSASLVAEAIWSFRQREDDNPMWEEAVGAVASLAGCDEEEAELRILQAIADGEVQPVLRGGRSKHWGLTIDEATSDRIWRRQHDITMPRRDPAEFFFEEG